LGVLEVLFPQVLSSSWSPEGIGTAMLLASVLAPAVLLSASGLTPQATFPTVAILLSGTSALLCLLLLPPEGSSASDLLLLSCLLPMACAGYPLSATSLVVRSLDSAQPQDPSRLLPFLGAFEAIGAIARLTVPWLLQWTLAPRLALGSYALLAVALVAVVWDAPEASTPRAHLLGAGKREQEGTEEDGL
jgi:hypothetical protein